MRASLTTEVDAKGLTDGFTAQFDGQRDEGTGERLRRHAFQNGMQCKTHELLVPGLFHLIFLDYG